MPDASGVMGDLGGGSLELVALGGARIGSSSTLPIGPLRLMSSGKADPRRNRILSTSVEHHAVLDSLHWLEEQGADLILLDRHLPDCDERECVRAIAALAPGVPVFQIEDTATVPVARDRERASAACAAPTCARSQHPMAGSAGFSAVCGDRLAALPQAIIGPAARQRPGQTPRPPARLRPRRHAALPVHRLRHRGSDRARRDQPPGTGGRTRAVG